MTVHVILSAFHIIRLKDYVQFSSETLKHTRPSFDAGLLMKFQSYVEKFCTKTWLMNENFEVMQKLFVNLQIDNGSQQKNIICLTYFCLMNSFPGT